MSSVLFLITARGGSKGVPGKNLKQIGGLSLIGWKARAAWRASYILERDQIICKTAISTDCTDIAEEAGRHGVEIPFMRPAALATDEAQSADVIRHALAWYAAKDQKFDLVVLLEPSAPFARPDHLLDAIRMHGSKSADLVVGMKETEPHTSFIAERRPDGNIANIIGRMRYGVLAPASDTRRQTRRHEWSMNGSLYVFDPRVLREGDIYSGLSYGYQMDHWHSIEIDTPHDLEMAEYAVARGYVKVPEPVGVVDRAMRSLGQMGL